MSNEEAPPEAFPQEDYDRLGELLDLHSPLDLDGVLGVLHALAVAPSVIQNEVWLPVVLGGNHASGDTALARYCVELLLRLKAEVQDAVNHGQLIMPDDDSIEDCLSFANGYVLGAELDRSWIGDASRWTFASGIAYLANRLDLVPAQTRQEIEQNLAPDPKALLRVQMGSLVQAAATSFKDLRVNGTDNNIRLDFVSKHSQGVASNTSTQSSPLCGHKTGRNDPCPCGSGRKFKRCCMS